jgi:hypothetical protein
MISTSEARRAYRRRGLGEGEAVAAESGSGTTAGIEILTALAPLGYALYKDRKDTKDRKSDAKKERAHEAAMQAEALKLAQAQQEYAAMQARLASVEAAKTQQTMGKWVAYAVGGGAILATLVVGYKLISKRGA